MNRLLLLLVIAGAIALVFAFRRVKLRYFLLSAAAGILALIGADFVCSFFHFNLPLNALSLMLAAVGGIPGVILYNVMAIVLAG
jgi:hypothetical protein